MSYTEKIDVLDLIIRVLQDHEEKLDALVGRLEAAVGEPGTRDPAEDLRRRFHEPL